MEYCSAITRSKFLIHAIEWMTLTCILLHEISQIQVQFHLFNVFGKGHTIGTENTSVIAREWGAGRG